MTRILGGLEAWWLGGWPLGKVAWRLEGFVSWRLWLGGLEAWLVHSRLRGLDTLWRQDKDGSSKSFGESPGCLVARRLEGLVACLLEGLACLWTLQVKCVSDEVDFKIFARLKGSAVKSELLVVLGAEDWLTWPDSEALLKIEESVLGKCRRARADWNLKMSASKSTTADELQVEIKTEAKRLSLMDKYWAVELAILNHLCGDGARSRCEAQLLSILPSVLVAREASQVAHKLALLMQAPSYKMTPRAVQGEWTFLAGCLKSIVNERPPTVQPSEGNPHLETI